MKKLKDLSKPQIVLLAGCLPAFFSICIIQFSVDKMFEYGLGIFIGTPFVTGLMATLIYAKQGVLTFGKSFRISLLAFVLMSFMLLIVGIEGLVCIVMSLPISFLSLLVGCFLGFIVQKRKHALLTALLAQILLLPSFVYVESTFTENDDYRVVSTEVIIDAGKQEVWNKLIEFSEIKEPLDFIFRNGISYPIDSKIEGEGIGAIRYCNFNTGSFVEPIDVWDEPNLLHFTVEEQPIPMKELSPYDIQPKHLHGYFVSEKGQFQLLNLGQNKTKLVGTTWYRIDIAPEFYWSLWTDEIIHKIHERVLYHIKSDSENKL